MSVQHGQVGKFKVSDLLDSAVLEHGQVGSGCRFATSCSAQICFATKTCSWKPVQIGVAGQVGVAGQPLASELGCLTRALGCFQPQGLGNKLETCGVSAAWAGWQV